MDSRQAFKKDLAEAQEKERQLATLITGEMSTDRNYDILCNSKKIECKFERFSLSKVYSRELKTTPNIFIELCNDKDVASGFMKSVEVKNEVYVHIFPSGEYVVANNEKLHNYLTQNIEKLNLKKIENGDWSNYGVALSVFKLQQLGLVKVYNFESFKDFLWK